MKRKRMDSSILKRIYEGHENIVKQLLSCEAGVDTRCKNGVTELMNACRRGIPNLVKLLLEAGANVDLQDDFGCTALIYAAMNRKGIKRNGAWDPDSLVPADNIELYEEVVDLLIKAGANVDTQNEKGKTALSHCAGDEEKLTELLLQGGADPNIQDKKGNTALHRATHDGCNRNVIRLIKAGANLDIQNKKGVTALMWSLYRPETAKILLEAGASPIIRNKMGFNSLDIAFTTKVCTEDYLQKSTEFSKLLIDTGVDINKKDPYGNTPLINASSYRDEEMVKYLLKKGAKVNLKSATGMTALMVATKCGNVAAVQALVKAGADIHNILLDVCYETSSSNLVEILIEAGASVNSLSHDWKNPLSVAFWGKNRGILRVLLSQKNTIPYVFDKLMRSVQYIIGEQPFYEFGFSSDCNIPTSLGNFVPDRILESLQISLHCRDITVYNRIVEYSKIFWDTFDYNSNGVLLKRALGMCVFGDPKEIRERLAAFICCNRKARFVSHDMERYIVKNILKIS